MDAQAIEFRGSVQRIERQPGGHPALGVYSWEMGHRQILPPYRYPSPAETGIRIPLHLVADRFSVGFEHALRGGQLDQVEYFRRSFRLGFRAAKLYVREVRRQHGVRELPTRYRFRLRTYWPES